MTEPREVVIDGVRYVPAREAVAGIEELREALIRDWWGDVPLPKGRDAGENLLVLVNDTGEGTPLNEFMDAMAARLTRSAI